MKKDEAAALPVPVSDDGTVTLFASQAQIVLDTLERDGIYCVKKAYIDRKYQDTAWIFRTAYAAFIRQMAARVPKPEGAESPVWLFADPRYAEVSADGIRIELRIPAEEAVFFDQRDWNRILNLSPLGTEEEVKKLADEMRRQGIPDFSDVFAKPFYPLFKKKITDTWKTLLEKGMPDREHAQAAVWYLKREWVVSCTDSMGKEVL